MKYLFEFLLCLLHSPALNGPLAFCYCLDSHSLCHNKNKTYPPSQGKMTPERYGYDLSLKTPHPKENLRLLGCHLIMITPSCIRINMRYPICEPLLSWSLHSCLDVSVENAVG